MDTDAPKAAEATTEEPVAPEEEEEPESDVELDMEGVIGNEIIS